MDVNGMRPKDTKVLIELANLLHTKGDAVLRGESKLSLTTQSLGLLYQVFQAVRQNENDGKASKFRNRRQTEQFYTDVLFLQDFLNKTQSVKIIHRSGTIRGSIQIGYFSRLGKLEVKKVPIHLIEGLHQLRSRLNSITCTRSIPFLQDLFESCGGDMTSPMSWVELREACLSYNSLSCLDSSLRLLPCLEALDVSHNSIERLENHLQYLTELVHINLGYNLISSVPQFSLSVRNKLKTLILRNNKLDHLEGVEDLVNLEELDVTNNCLSDHSRLDILHTLDNLSLVCLLGNPLAYHKSHRSLTLQHVSPIAVKKTFILDGMKITEAEAMLTVRHRVHTSPSRRPTQMADTLITESKQISNSYTFSDSDAIAHSLPVNPIAIRKKAKSKSKIRSRKSLIAEFESSTDTATGLSSRDSSRAPSPIMKKKFSPPRDSNKEAFEVMREHYGSDWLRAFNNNPDDGIKSGSSSDQLVAATEDDIYLNDSGTGLDPIDHSQLFPTTLQDSTEDGVFDKRPLPNETGNTELVSPKGLDSEHGVEWKRTDSEQCEHYGLESEPFIVMLEDNKQFFLSVNDRYLLEKDMNGDVKEMLDIKLLESIECRPETHSVPGTDQYTTLPVIHLSFDYIRRDRRERVYIMEDEENAEELQNILKPTLEAKFYLKKLKQQLQCLKCSSKFLKSEAQIKVENQQRGDTFTSTQQDDFLDSFTCPKCDSEMVVEVDLTTPVGSLPTLLDVQPQNSSTPNKLVPTNKQDTDKVNDHLKSVKDSSPRPIFTIGSFENSRILQKTTDKKRFSLPSVLLPATSWKPQLPASVVNSGNSVVSVTEVYELGNSNADNTKPTSKDINAHEYESVANIDIKSTHSVHAFRARQNSTGSDIAILSNPSDGSVGNLLDNTDDDRVRLSKLGGRTVSPILERNVNCDQEALTSQLSKKTDNTNGDRIEQNGVLSHLDPTALSLSVCNSMVSSVYENTISTPGQKNSCDKDDQDGTLETEAEISIYDNTGKPVVRDTDTADCGSSRPGLGVVSVLLSEGDSTRENSVGFNPDNPVEDNLVRLQSNESSLLLHPDRDSVIDFSVLDHRLQLHFHISLLKETEDCVCMLQCGIVQYMIKEEFEGIMLLTTENLYILKISPDMKRKKEDEVKSWLRCIEAQPHAELRYIDMGLGNQSFRLEFNTDCSSYSFIVRDDKKCEAFIQLIRDNINDSSPEVTLHPNRETLENLTKDILMSEDGIECSEDLDDMGSCADTIHYITGSITKDDVSSSVGILVTEANIYLVKENHQWPLPRLQAPLSPDIKDKQFIVVEKQPINNVVLIHYFTDDIKTLKISFVDEESSREIDWCIRLETRQGVDLLVAWIKQPWDEEFGVELETTWIDSDMDQQT